MKRYIEEDDKSEKKKKKKKKDKKSKVKRTELGLTENFKVIME